jgi:hypothetical protein
MFSFAFTYEAKTVVLKFYHSMNYFCITTIPGLFVNKVMNLQVSQYVGKILIAAQLAASQEGLSLIEIVS